MAIVIGRNSLAAEKHQRRTRLYAQADGRPAAHTGEGEAQAGEMTAKARRLPRATSEHAPLPRRGFTWHFQARAAGPGNPPPG